MSGFLTNCNNVDANLRIECLSSTLTLIVNQPITTITSYLVNVTIIVPSNINCFEIPICDIISNMQFHIQLITSTGLSDVTIQFNSILCSSILGQSFVKVDINFNIFPQIPACGFIFWC